MHRTQTNWTSSFSKLSGRKMDEGALYGRPHSLAFVDCIFSRKRVDCRALRVLLGFPRFWLWRLWRHLTARLSCRAPQSFPSESLVPSVSISRLFEFSRSCLVVDSVTNFLHRLGITAPGTKQHHESRSNLSDRQRKTLAFRSCAGSRRLRKL